MGVPDRGKARVAGSQPGLQSLVQVVVVSEIPAANGTGGEEDDLGVAELLSVYGPIPFLCREAAVEMVQSLRVSAEPSVTRHALSPIS